MDTQELGVVSLVLGPQGGAAALLSAIATGHPERFPGFDTWSTPTFEVTSDAPIEIGLDGETQVMDPPLRFSMRPAQVRVRLPRALLRRWRGARPLRPLRRRGGLPSPGRRRGLSLRSST